MIKLENYPGEVTNLKFYNDYIIYTGFNPIVKVMKLSNKRLINLKSHSKGISSLSVQSKNFITGSFDGSIKLWNLKTNLFTLSETENINSLDFYHPKKFAYSTDQKICLFDIKQETKILEIKTKSHIIKFDQKMIYSAGLDGLEIFDQKESVDLTKEKTYSLALEFPYMLSGHDSYYSLWDLRTQQVIKDMKVHSGPVKSLAIKNSYFLSGGVDQKTILYHDSIIETIDHSHFITAVDLNDHNLVSADLNGTIIHKEYI